MGSVAGYIPRPNPQSDFAAARSGIQATLAACRKGRQSPVTPAGVSLGVQKSHETLRPDSVSNATLSASRPGARPLDIGSAQGAA
jgi:hypothetical protein